MIKAAFLWSGLVALLFSLCYAVAGTQIIALLTDQAAVRAAAVQFLPYVVALPIISVFGYMLDGVFIGAIRTRELRDSMFISTAIFLVTAYSLQQLWGNHGLWIAMIVLMVARTVTLGRNLKQIITAV